MHAQQAERITQANAILLLLTGDLAAKVQAAWVALREVMQALPVRSPERRAFPAPLAGVTAEQIARELTQEPEERAPWVGVFCAYRAAVYDLEAQNSARLSVVVGALKRIEWLRHPDRAEYVPADARATLDAFEQGLLAHLKRAWHLDPPQPHEDWREWCSARTRSYDLLPMAWRAL